MRKRSPENPGNVSRVGLAVMVPSANLLYI